MRPYSKATFAVIACVFAVGAASFSMVFQSSLAIADPQPENPMDPVELFSSAETLNSEQAGALATFLQSARWGVASGQFEWRFTGTAVPVGAYSTNPVIEDDETVLPDGIYWVGIGGDLITGDHVYVFDGGDLFIVGEAWDAPEEGISKTVCPDGYYACCTYKLGGLQEAIGYCFRDGTSPPGGIECVAGGEGTKKCQLGGTGSTGGPCVVGCRDGYYACCGLDNQQRPTCECKPITGNTHPCLGNDYGPKEECEQGNAPVQMLELESGDGEP